MYRTPPMLSASFTPQGKKVQRRLANILEHKKRENGWFLPLFAVLVLMLGSLVACAPGMTAMVTLPPQTEQIETELPAEETTLYRSPLAKETAILAPYGTRVHPITGVETVHHGVDLSADEGDPVLASAKGTVVSAEYTDAYGYCVTVSHANGQESFYGHLQAFSVEAGTAVSSGGEIGKVGQTGFATAPHLHFEIRENGVTLDPTDIVS